MIDRYGFHLENVAGRGRAVDPRGVRARVLRRGAERSAGGADPSGSGRPRAARRVPELRAARLARRRAHAAARREATSRRARGRERAARARVRCARSARQRGSKRIAALEELREVLNLESLPVRIECFDISNIQGESIVASMTVFVDGRSKNAHYRTFAIRGLDGQDDVGAMREAVSRRFARLRDGELDESFSRMPNLVVVDGGKGQLGAALAAMRGVRPPARRGHLAREARRGGLRAGVSGADRARPLEPRATAPPAHPRRGAPRRAPLPPAKARRSARWRRSSRGFPAWGRCGVARSSGTSVPSSAFSRPRRRSSRAFPASRRRPRAISTRSSTRQARPSSPRSPRAARAPCGSGRCVASAQSP